MLSETSQTLAPISNSSMASGPFPVETELEFHEIAAGLLRRRYVILICALLGLLGGLLAGLFTGQTFSATATVEFAQPSTRALGLEDPSFTAGELSTLELLNTELKTQEAEIMDDNTAFAVIRQLHLDTEPPYALPATLSQKDPLSRERGLPFDRAPRQRERVLKIFQQHLSVDVVKGTRLLHVTFTDVNPERAAAVANAVVGASIDQTSHRRFAAVSQVSSWLTDQLAALKQRVEDSQRRAEEYEGANGKDLAGMALSAVNSAGRASQMDSPSATESVPVSRLLTLNNELTAAQVSRISKEAIYRVAESGDPDAVLSIANSTLVMAQGADSSLAPGNGGLALLQRLRQQQVDLHVQAATASTRYGAKNPLMVEYRQQQDAVQSQMQSELNHIRDRARSDLDLAIRSENGLRQQVTQQQDEVSQWTTKADHLVLLRGEAAASRALYQDLYAKLQESEFAAGIQASHVMLLDQARVPTAASSPRKKVDVMLGLLVGFVVGFAAALGIELFDDSVHTEEAARKLLGAPVLGTIPRFPRGAANSAVWVITEPRSHIAEAYRAFRTALFANRPASLCKVLLVASPHPAEGKATTCLNTGAALAVQGHRVLIIDADMRRDAAKAGPFCGASPLAGLSRCLAEGLPAKEAIEPVPKTANLFLLPAGPVPNNPAELLSSPEFTQLLHSLRTQFEYILLDSPPVLLFTDAQILSTCADACVLVVQAAVTPRREVRRTVESLYNSGAILLGIVLNGAKAKRPMYERFGYGV